MQIKFLKEFSYPDIFQRRILFYNSFFTFVIIGFIYSSLSFLLKYYSIYESISEILLLNITIGIFSGNLAGRFIFSRTSKFRIIFVVSDLLFVILCALFVLRGLIFYKVGEDVLVYIFFHSRNFFYLILLILTFFAGIKINYYLKITCGEFIDEKNGIINLLSLLVIGIFAGIISGAAIYLYPDFYYSAALILLFIIPTIFLIKLPYNPSPIYTQELKDHKEETPSVGERSKRDDLFFVYLNFTYIVIYLFLGYKSIVKFFGNDLHVEFSFMCICLFFGLAGYTVARIFKLAFWHIYAEMLYPVFFILFLASINALKDNLQFYEGIALFIPASIVFGFSVYHTLQNILLNNNHNKRFGIIDFSLFVLPVPLFAALLHIDFTNLWYFIVLYVVAFMNILFPGLHLLQRQISGYKKLLYFLFSLIVIPLIIVVHLYYAIPLNSNLYVTHTSGFENLQNTNFNSPFIKQNVSVFYNGKKIFLSNDYTLKNLQRSLISVLLFNLESSGGVSNTLFIDGNQKFFKNPLLACFKNAKCLDYVPARIVDLQRLPFSDKYFYFTESDSLMAYLYEIKNPFRIIADIPNLFDQNYNIFRFSNEYYRQIKKHLLPNGIFVQIINLSHCRSDFFFSACSHYKMNFKKTIGFLYSDHLVIMGSDDAGAFSLTNEGMNTINNIFKNRQEMSYLFFNEYQPLTYYAFSSVDDIIVFLKETTISPFFFLQKKTAWQLDDNLKNNYISNNSKILELIDNTPANLHFKNNIYVSLARSSAIFSLLKQAGLYEANNEYESEIEMFFQLKRYAEYDYDLRTYNANVLSFKEEYYLFEAMRLEKNRQWEDARRLYKAILKINKNNFEANYRMGILSITLQDLDDAFQYLQLAMQMKKDDTKVLYQMGVLLFSSGRTDEALVYFNRALELKENSASIFHYMGLCYEKLNRLNEAKSFYERALIIDPNDGNIKSSLEKINQAFEAEKAKWKAPDLKNQPDAEQDENIPLPINKSAQDIRLKDSDENGPK